MKRATDYVLSVMEHESGEKTYIILKNEEQIYIGKTWLGTLRKLITEAKNDGFE